MVGVLDPCLAREVLVGAGTQVETKQLLMVVGDEDGGSEEP